MEKIELEEALDAETLDFDQPELDAASLDFDQPAAVADSLVDF